LRAQAVNPELTNEDRRAEEVKLQRMVYTPIPADAAMAAEGITPAAAPTAASASPRTPGGGAALPEIEHRQCASRGELESSPSVGAPRSPPIYKQLKQLKAQTHGDPHALAAAMRGLLRVPTPMSMTTLSPLGAGLGPLGPGPGLGPHGAGAPLRTSASAGVLM
jgi:hypothetical protein